MEPIDGEAGRHNFLRASLPVISGSTSLGTRRLRKGDIKTKVFVTPYGLVDRKLGRL